MALDTWKGVTWRWKQVWTWWMRAALLPIWTVQMFIALSWQLFRSCEINYIPSVIFFLLFVYCIVPLLVAWSRIELMLRLSELRSSEYIYVKHCCLLLILHLVNLCNWNRAGTLNLIWRSSVFCILDVVLVGVPFTVVYRRPYIGSWRSTRVLEDVLSTNFSFDCIEFNGSIPMLLCNRW